MTDAIKHFMPNMINKNNELNVSNYCLDYIYDLKDGDIRLIFDKLSNNQFISMIIQILYA